MKISKNARCLYIGCHAPAMFEEIVLTDDGDYVYTLCCEAHAGPEAEPLSDDGESRLHE